MTIEATQVTKAYKGKEGECCCGCSGKYYYASEGKQKQIAKIVAAMNEIEAQGGSIEENGPGSYTAENGPTRYIVNY